MNDEVDREALYLKSGYLEIYRYLVAILSVVFIPTIVLIPILFFFGDATVAYLGVVYLLFFAFVGGLLLFFLKPSNFKKKLSKVDSFSDAHIEKVYHLFRLRVLNISFRHSDNIVKTVCLVAKDPSRSVGDTVSIVYESDNPKNAVLK